MELFSSSVYLERRRKLSKMMGEGILVFIGNSPSPINYAGNCYPFRQDSNFLYFFGIAMPNLIGVINAYTGEEFIFGDEAHPDEIVWTGLTDTLSSLKSKVGVLNLRPLKEFEEQIQTYSRASKEIYISPVYRAESQRKLKVIERYYSPNNALGNNSKLIGAIISLRSIKEKHEIDEIKKAIVVAKDMFSSARQMLKPGVSESEVAAYMSYVAAKYGCRTSFPIIATKNGHILHSHPENVPLPQGGLFIIDAGAETPKGYASDITRTFPIGSQWSHQQKDIYNIVLEANETAINHIRPNISYRDIHLLSARSIASNLVALGLMKGDADSIIASGAHALFFPHGLGHLMGLDVHDMESMGEDYVGYDGEYKRSNQFGLSYLRYAKKLLPGQVITVEPGCYFNPHLIQSWKAKQMYTDFINYDNVSKFMHLGGVRIEDDVLVTHDGNICLSSDIPKIASQIL